MSLQFTGDNVAIRRLDNLPSSHANFTICGFAKLLTAAPDRVATIAYTQTAVGDSAEMYVLGGDGTKARATDDYGGTVSADIATVTAGGASGANWFFWALVGVGTGTTGIRGYHATIGGVPTFQTVNNRAAASPFSVIQFGDLPYGEAGWFNGLLAHVKVYNRALSDAELQAEASRGDPASASGLISYHSFSSMTLATALTPDQGAGALSSFTSDPTTNADMPVFASASSPVLSGSDTLPQRQGVAPNIVTTSLASGLVGAAYLQTVAASGDAPITFSITAGALPSGLSLNASTGVISGTSSALGSASFTVTATNAFGSDAQALAILIESPFEAPTVTTTSLPPGSVGTAYFQTLEATGDAPITWSVVSGTLPTGIELLGASPAAAGFVLPGMAMLFSGSGSSGSVLPSISYFLPSVSLLTAAQAPESGVALTGVPVGAGTSTFTVRATNDAGSDDQVLTLLVTQPGVGPAITTSSLAAGRVETAYSQTMTATGTTPITWSVAAGPLPGGLTLNSATGVLSGLPTTAGVFTVSIAATNSLGTAARSYTLTIEQKIVQPPPVDPPPVDPPPPSDEGWVRLPRGTEVWVRVPRQQ